MFDAIALLTNEQTSGTDGGGFTSGARRTVVLNTEAFDPSGIVSLSSNQFTLAAGVYMVSAYVAVHAVDSHKAWLYNVTDATDEAIGASSYAQNSSSISGVARVDAYVSITSSKTFEVQAQCETTQATNGFGYANSWGTECYASVAIRRLGTNTDYSVAGVARTETLGTEGGNIATGAWRTLQLNGELFDADGIATVASNQITLGAGTYEVVAYQPVFYECERAQTRIYNATDSAIIQEGLSQREGGSGGAANGLTVAQFTLAGTKAIEFQVRLAIANNPFGGGVGADFDTEQYSTVLIRKI
jgi:hypothetical protein